MDIEGNLIVVGLCLVSAITQGSNKSLIQIRSDQSLSRVQLFVTPWIAARQASLSITSFRSLLKLMSTESVMPSNCLIFC